jgi:Pyruvate/2-oxoacid:ferredoxin oxidoreductase delta subunit
MATMITSECINCGACEPECPNNAISQAEEIYVIDPLLCTECVGFHDYEACAAVCPVDCCVTDPNNVEGEEALIARAKEIHKDVAFADNFESRFRKDAGAPAAGAAEQPAVPTPAQPKAPEKAPLPAQTAAAPKPPPRPAAAKPAPLAPEPPKSAKHFPGELPEGFNEVFSRFQNQGPLTKTLPRLILCILQPLLGAMPHPTKMELEKAVAKPIAFSAAGATALNILMNLVMYPLILMAIGAAAVGPDVIFSQSINGYILTGVLFGFIEGAYRVREGIFHAKPADELVYRAAFYGVPLAIALRPLLERQAGMVRSLPTPVDGFYERGFVEKLERERRYGNAYTLQDWGSAYFLRMEFPTKVPDIGIPARSALPDVMPDYDYDLVLKDGHFIIKGRITDERIRKISSSVGAFPPEFTTVIALQERIEGFSHRFANKLLEILLLKQPARAVQGIPFP